MSKLFLLDFCNRYERRKSHFRYTSTIVIKIIHNYCNVFFFSKWICNFQRSHQQLAEEKKLHLVEFREENENYPTVVASPSYVRTKEEISKDETLDFNQYVMNDRVILKRKKFPRFYETMPHYEIFLKKYEKYRNHEKIRLNLKTEYGEIKSFLNDKYPEEKVEKDS